MGEQAPGSESTSATNSNQSPKAFTKDVVYVLFDYSKSLDPNSIKVTAARAFDLVKNCPVGVTIKFLPINNEVFAQAVASHTRTSKPDKPKDVAPWQRQIGDDAAKAFKTIYDLYEQQDVKSCIVNGFTTVLNHAQNLPEGSRARLVVLSDMLECCEDLPCVQRFENLAPLMHRIEEYHLASCPLSKYVPFENITVVVNSSPNPQYQKISKSQEFYQFWDAVAKGMGYEKRWRFSPDLPTL